MLIEALKHSIARTIEVNKSDHESWMSAIKEANAHAVAIPLKKSEDLERNTCLTSRFFILHILFLTKKIPSMKTGSLVFITARRSFAYDKLVRAATAWDTFSIS